MPVLKPRLEPVPTPPPPPWAPRLGLKDISPTEPSGSWQKIQLQKLDPWPTSKDELETRLPENKTNYEIIPASTSIQPGPRAKIRPGQDLGDHGDDDDSTTLMARALDKAMFKTKNLATQATSKPRTDNFKTHILPNFDSSVSLTNLKSILESVPEGIHQNLSLELIGDRGSCWTYEFTGVEAYDTLVPLTIARLPVVVNVSYEYPVTASFVPMPDPVSDLLDPTKSMSDEVIETFFAVFQNCLGFYLLINGRLQVIVPDDFNYEDASIDEPITFGGLKVSYIRENIIPTADTSSNNLSTQQSRSSADANDAILQTGSTSTTSSLGVFSTRRSPPIKIEVPIGVIPREGDTVFFCPEDRGRLSLDKYARVRGKIGLLLYDQDHVYATAPSHVICKMLASSRTTIEPSENWIRGLSAYSESERKKFGAVVRTFDPKPGVFPRGFKHDVSLIKIEHDRAAVMTRRRFNFRLEWSEDSIDFQNAKLCFLHDPDLVGIGFEPRDTQIVGQAIFKTKYPQISDSLFQGKSSQKMRSRMRSLFSRKKAQESPIEPKDWETAVSYSSALLYRLATENHRADAYMSGTVVCLDHRSDAGCVKIAGFNGFAQVATHDPFVVGNSFASKLAKGSIAFLGAFRVPKDMRYEYEIQQ